MLEGDRGDKTGEGVVKYICTVIESSETYFNHDIIHVLF
jgi:hypothetical protein